MELLVPNSCDSTFIRSGTVVRRAPFREDRVTSTSSTEDGKDPRKMSLFQFNNLRKKFADDTTPAEKYRKESQYRHSLTAISERRNLNQGALCKELAKISRYFKKPFFKILTKR